MIYCSTKKGETIFRQGDEAAYFFVIERGQIAVNINSEFKKNMSRGDGFGELALLYSAPRSADIITDSDCYMFAIDRTKFRNAVQEITTKIKDLTAKTGKEVMIVETAFPWTTNNADNYGNIISGTNLPSGYQATKNGQLKYMKE